MQNLLENRERILAQNKRESEYAVKPHLPACDVLLDRAWADSPCFIIAGGPSLSGFDFERLRGRGKVVVINKGFTRVPFADVLFFMDHANFYVPLMKGKFGAEAITAWKEFRGFKVFLNIMGREVNDAYSVRSLGETGLSTSLRRGLYHGNNCGVGAIGLAVCMAANPIYLLGYDLKHDGRVSHWHGGYNRHQPESILRAYRHQLELLAGLLHRTQFKVINLNPKSVLRAFPFDDIDKILAESPASEATA